MELNYTPRWLAILSPNVSLSGRYHESSRPSFGSLGRPRGLKSIDNGGTARSPRSCRSTIRAEDELEARYKGGAYALSRSIDLLPAPDIQGTFSFERGSVITRVAGDAGFPFETGFTGACLPASRRSTTRSSPRIGRTPPGEHHDPSHVEHHGRRARRSPASPSRTKPGRRAAPLQLTLPDLKARWLDLNASWASRARSTRCRSIPDTTSGGGDRPQDGPWITGQHDDWQPSSAGIGLAERPPRNISTAVVQATSLDQRSFGIGGSASR